MDNSAASGPQAWRWRCHCLPGAKTLAWSYLLLQPEDGRHVFAR